MKLRILLVLPLASGTLAAQAYDPGPKATPAAGAVAPAEQKAVVPSFPGQVNRTIDVNAPPPVPTPPPEPRLSPVDLPGPGVSVAPSPTVTGSPRAGVSKKKTAKTATSAKAPKKAKGKTVKSTTGPDGRVVLSNDR
jgi:hypothetical protein